MMTAPRMAISIDIDRDELAAALVAAADLVRYMDPMSLSGEDKEMVMAAKLLQAAIARKVNNNAAAHTPDFLYSQVKAAAIVAAALRLDKQTFRANKPWLLLAQKGLGEGIGFRTLGVRNRRYTQGAVDYLIAHWDRTRMAMR
ncbi:hypothetical protein [Acidithiobacillus sp.]